MDTIGIVLFVPVGVTLIVAGLVEAWATVARLLGKD